MVLETRFDLHQKVKVLPFETEGRVYSITYDGDGVTYWVRFYLNSEQKKFNFHEYELEKL